MKSCIAGNSVWAMSNLLKVTDGFEKPFAMKASLNLWLSEPKIFGEVLPHWKPSERS